MDLSSALNSKKDPILQIMDLTDDCMENLRQLKLHLQIRLDCKKPSAPAPLPPPLPDLFKPTEKSINFKSINGISFSSGRTLLHHVSTKKRPETLFDIEISATVKKRRAELDRIGRPESYWNSLYAPPAKRQKTEFEAQLECNFKRRNGIEVMDQDE